MTTGSTKRSWETDSGDKRSKVQVTAEEIGSSLRWATVEVSKNDGTLAEITRLP